MRTRLPTKPNTHSGSAATCTLQTVLLALGKWLLGSATLEPLADQAKTRLQCFMMVRVWTERESKLENTCVLLPPAPPLRVAMDTPEMLVLFVPFFFFPFLFTVVGKVLFFWEGLLGWGWLIKAISQ